MIWVFLISSVNLVFQSVIASIGTLFAIVFPVEVDTYWNAVDSIFTGIRALDTFLPISELIVLSTVGVLLNLALGVLVNGWGLGRIVLSLILFWRK